MKQNIAFLYLNTGGGHIAPAKALAGEIRKTWPGESETFLLDGFSDKMRMPRFFFENGYALTSNFFEAGYVLFYRATEFPACIEFGNMLVSIHGVDHLARLFRENGITKVVCMHSVLIMMTRNAINRVDPSIKMITVVTDPFTAHGLWFYEKRTELIVFSEKLRQEAIGRYGFSSDRVHAFPFILSRSYERRYTPEEIAAAKRRLSIPEGRKVILVAGGGEGLKSADRLVSCFVKRKRDEIMLVVCGRNKFLRRLVRGIAERSGADNVITYDFVSFMPDLLNIADCVITKGGASTVMEVLAVGKPVIFSTFIRGQELGNVLYTVYNGAGWYLKKPAEILDRAQKILEDPACAAKVRANTARLHIRNGLDELSKFIHDL